MNEFRLGPGIVTIPEWPWAGTPKFSAATWRNRLELRIVSRVWRNKVETRTLVDIGSRVVQKHVIVVPIGAADVERQPVDRTIRFGLAGASVRLNRSVELGFVIVRGGNGVVALLRRGEDTPVVGIADRPGNEEIGVPVFGGNVERLARMLPFGVRKFPQLILSRVIAAIDIPRLTEKILLQVMDGLNLSTPREIFRRSTSYRRSLERVAPADFFVAELILRMLVPDFFLKVCAVIVVFVLRICRCDIRDVRPSRIVRLIPCPVTPALKTHASWYGSFCEGERTVELPVPIRRC